VQQTFGGAARVAFPVGAGYLMDHLGRGTPFLVAGLLVLASPPPSRGLGRPVPAANPAD